MNRLSTVEAMRERANVDDIPEFNTAFEKGLITASTELRQLLRTDFDRVSGRDVFIPRYVVDFAGTKVLNLALRRGFLAADPIITYGSSFTDADANPITDFLCNKDDGTVQIRSATDMTGKVIVVNYTAGFEVEGNGEYKDVPEWLVTASEQIALTIVDRTVPGLRGELAREWQETAKAIRAGLTSHIRFFPGYEKPI